MGAHGGAGVSTLAHYLSFTGDSDEQWPCGTDVENESPYVVMVARETDYGLKKAPGNVRELENEVERALALADDGRPIGVEHLSERVRDAGRAGSSPSTLNEAIEELKRRMIEDALRECGSKTRAAERLGLTRQSLQQMLRRREP